MVQLGAGGQVGGQPGTELGEAVAGAQCGSRPASQDAAWAERMGKPCSLAVAMARSAQRRVSAGSPRYW
jgi:hypothetical protein